MFGRPWPIEKFRLVEVRTIDVFERYAQYYDLLYRDKDYGREAEYVHRLIQAHCPGAATILELGCGSGGHAPHLARLGYKVHGIDASEGMIRKAHEKHLTLEEGLRERISFTHGDVRILRTGSVYDAVVSLFHVMSYQTSNEDLDGSFATAKAHLKTGGIFLFDCWYGPAVLSERPSVRVKRLEDKKIRVIRIAEPLLHADRNRVDVKYHVIIRSKGDGSIEELSETHPMRYLFLPEVERLLSSLGFALVDHQEWMTGRTPGIDTWNVCFVARA